MCIRDRLRDFERGPSEKLPLVCPFHSGTILACPVVTSQAQVDGDVYKRQVLDLVESVLCGVEGERPVNLAVAGDVGRYLNFRNFVRKVYRLGGNIRCRKN